MAKAVFQRPDAPAFDHHGADGRAATYAGRRPADDDCGISDEDLVLFDSAYRSVVAASDVALFRRGLSRSHHRAMFVLRRERSAIVGELARGIRISTQALQKTLRDIVERGYATIVSDPQDRRRRSIQLTRLGDELESEVTGLQIAALCEMRNRVGAEAVDLWRHALRALANSDEAGAPRREQAGS